MIRYQNVSPVDGAEVLLHSVARGTLWGTRTELIWHMHNNSRERVIFQLRPVTFAQFADLTAACTAAYFNPRTGRHS